MAPTDKDPAAIGSRDKTDPANKFPYLKPHQLPTAYLRPLKKHKNMEARARAGRHHGTLNFSSDLQQALFAYGGATHPDITDPHPDSRDYLHRLPTLNTSHRPSSFQGTVTPGAPFPETLRVLDEILTDFIIEVTNEATDHATYEGRHKVNPGDVSWVFRNDRHMLGRIGLMHRRNKEIKDAKKSAQIDAGEAVGGIGGAGGGGRGLGGLGGVKMTVEEMEVMAEIVGEEGTGRGKGKGKGRRKRKAVELDGEGDDGRGVNGAADADSPTGGMGSDGGDADAEDVRSTKRARSEVT